VDRSGSIGTEIQLPISCIFSFTRYAEEIKGANLVGEVDSEEECIFRPLKTLERK